MASAVISTTQLAIGYTSRKNETIVSKNINLELLQNELIAVIGVNGSGKSTLLRTLSGLQKPLDGKCFIDGTSVSAYNAKTLAKVMSLVLTEQGISKNLTVKELVALGRQPYTNWIGSLSEHDINYIQKALEHVDIADLAEERCGEISDGQLQKVLIARALAQDTKIVILDEPTTHLDLHHKAYILQLLKKLVRETQKTVLFATHEINLALPLCDRLIIVANGNVHSGTPQELISNGLLSSIFPKDLIEFNTSSKQFVVTSK